MAHKPDVLLLDIRMPACAYASALVLLALLLGMNALATALVQHWQRRKRLVLG